MATISITQKLELSKQETARFDKIMKLDSPCKDIQPASLEEKQKSEADVKKWLAKSIH